MDSLNLVEGRLGTIPGVGVKALLLILRGGIPESAHFLKELHCRDSFQGPKVTFKHVKFHQN